MRNPSLICKTWVLGLVCLSATLAAAQGKIASTWHCPKPAGGANYQIGDQPGHSYALVQYHCTASKGEIATVKEKEGTSTEFSEMSGDKSSGHGMFVATMANGDHVHYSFTSQSTWKNGMMQSGSNKFEVKGGTGKFKGAKGSGTCAGKGNKDGSADFTCTGTYTGVM
ncbi:MAG: hypothetical protein HYX28_02515 [Candidatus Koribacter versatilis]|uniref:Uncharacterized protein n=1 Tax=Candidatus Korobacter versatilis TaxID=658062 RepID=A0A932A8P6_9BACT|nr:hypothetical protein [Candidatus Koribacter versatilis]